MQVLTSKQGEAILDLVDQCRTVTAAYDQVRSFQQNPMKGAGPVVKKLYDDAIKALAEICIEAEKIGVDKNTLAGIMLRDLPEDFPPVA